MKAIKINELRCGNSIYGADDTVVITVDVAELCLLERHPNLAMPIPLTPEILIACGFTKLNNAFIIDDGSRDKYGNMIMGDKTFSLFDYSYGKASKLMIGHTEVNSLHQLQNLYFALTGEELIYKP